MSDFTLIAGSTEGSSCASAPSLMNESVSAGALAELSTGRLILSSSQQRAPRLRAWQTLLI